MDSWPVEVRAESKREDSDLVPVRNSPARQGALRAVRASTAAAERSIAIGANVPPHCAAISLIELSYSSV